jgi:hypothetical protein
MNVADDIENLYARSGKALRVAFVATGYAALAAARVKRSADFDCVSGLPILLECVMNVADDIENLYARSGDMGRAIGNRPYNPLYDAIATYVQLP